MGRFRPGMSQQHLLHEADLSAILTLPSRLCWSLNAAAALVYKSQGQVYSGNRALYVGKGLFQAIGAGRDFVQRGGKRGDLAFRGGHGNAGQETDRFRFPIAVSQLVAMGGVERDPLDVFRGRAVYVPPAGRAWFPHPARGGPATA